MKHLIYLLTVFAALAFCRCTNESQIYLTKKDSDKTVKVTGFIHNRDRYPNTGTIRLDLPDLRGESFRLESPIEKDGTFKFNFDLEQPQDADITTYLEFLYLRPGDSLHIELDFDNFLNVKFSGGEAAKINEDFQKYILATSFRAGNIRIGTNDQNNLSVSEIRRQLDEKKSVLYEKRDAFLKENEVCDEVVELSESMIELAYYDALIHAMVMRKTILKKDFIKPDELMNEINSKIVPYFSGKYYSAANFKFITSGYMGLYYLTNDTFTDSSTESVKKTIEKMAKNDTIKDFIIASRAGHALASKDLKLFEELYPQIRMKYLTDRLTNEHTMTVARIRNAENISASITGAPSSDFPSTKVGNDMNLIEEMIKPGKGKVHIIDIGTTWCSPCIKDLSAYKKLSEEFEGQEVIFSFLCIGGDEQKFIEYLKKNDLTDFPYHFCTKEEADFIRKTLSINSIPIGLLINRKGIIVDHGSYIRPNKSLEEKIKLLLQQDNLL